jgi:site-specific DNA-methyltransferase (adenine-specific)
MAQMSAALDRPLLSPSITIHTASSSIDGDVDDPPAGDDDSPRAGNMDPGGPALSSPAFNLGQCDAVTWLRSLADESVDLLITDPAYESLEKHRAIGTTTRLKHSKASSNDWFPIFPNARFSELFAEAYRVLARDAHFYLFCDQETMFVAKPLGEAAGFKFWKPLVWDKMRIGMGYHYRARYECILFFEKGKRKLADLGVPDIIEAPRVIDGYPTEKPIEVSQVLIRQSSSPGEVVADPFLGSGSVGEAALRLGRNFLGNDIAASSLDVALPRLSAVGLQVGSTTASGTTSGTTSGTIVRGWCGGPGSRS